MNKPNSRTFDEFLKNVSVPLLTLAYLLGVLARIHQGAATVGWRIFFVTVLCLTIAWSVYTWTARELTVVEPRQLTRRYGPWVRYGSIVAVIIAVVPLVLSFRPEPGMPKMPIHLVNHSDSPISVNRWGEFYLSVPESPMTELQVGSGRIVILAEDDPEATSVTVGAKGTKEVFAVFVNSVRFVPSLRAGDRSARFVFYQEDGQILTRGGVHFTWENIGDRYLLLELKEPRAAMGNEHSYNYFPGAVDASAAAGFISR